MDPDMPRKIADTTLSHGPLSLESGAPSVPAVDGAADPSDLRARLREDTINGVLAPGQRLKVEDLRGRYSASVGSLRETLMQLVSEGFVITEANRGFCVAPVSIADLDDITNRRVDLECQALTLAIEHGDDRWEANIVAAYHMLTKLDPTDRSKPARRMWWERHNQYHEALVAACPSPWLLRFREILFDHSHRYRSISIQHSSSPGRLDEHRTLMEATLRRDVATATREVEDHIRETTANVRRWLMSQQQAG
jgi:DNA-binding GntR family transcriptional regulator